jgi:hypothetical protein
MDVIGLTEKKLNLTTHQALKYLSELIGVPGQEPKPKTEIEIFKDTAVLKKVFGHFETTFLGSKPAKDYATSRHLNIKTQTIGYNAGTFHHSSTKLTTGGENKYLIESAVKLGLLLQSNNSRGHPVFGLGSLVFALRDEKNQITGMYF